MLTILTLRRVPVFPIVVEHTSISILLLLCTRYCARVPLSHHVSTVSVIYLYSTFYLFYGQGDSASTSQQARPVVKPSQANKPANKPSHNPSRKSQARPQAISEATSKHKQASTSTNKQAQAQASKHKHKRKNEPRTRTQEHKKSTHVYVRSIFRSTRRWYLRATSPKKTRLDFRVGHN